MGAGAHQQIPGPAVAAADRAAFAAQASQGRDRQQALAAAAAVAPQDFAAMHRQGLVEPLVHPFHPSPGGAGRRHQRHRDPHHLCAAHRRQVGEVGRGGPPAHIGRPGGGVAEMHPLHQHIGVDHQLLPGVGRPSQEGSIIGELTWRREGSEPADQLPLSQVCQGLPHGSDQPWGLRLSAPSMTRAETIRSSTPSSWSTSMPSTT